MKIIQKLMSYKYFKVLFFALIITGQLNVYSQSATETRTFEKSFLVSEEMNLEIINKYGKVHLAPSNNDSVHVRIEMHASAKNNSRLRKLIDGISFELSSTNYFIIAKTNFNKGPANLFEGLRAFTNNIISTDSKIEINYFVDVPESIEIKIDNRYGDIYIESLACNFNIYHSNGALKIDDLSGNNYFDLNFCDGSINALQKARMNISYSDINIDYAEDLNINSVSSKIQLGTILSLRNNSKRDRLFIERISKIEGESYFTTYNIEELFNELSLNTKYGSVKVNDLKADFDLINLESSYSDIRIKSSPASSFNLDIKLSNCPSTIPEDWNLEETVLSEDRKEYLYFGAIGDKASKKKILLKLTKGSLSLY